jgi:CheY-like chemotaxis protein
MATVARPSAVGPREAVAASLPATAPSDPQRPTPTTRDAQGTDASDSHARKSHRLKVLLADDDLNIRRIVSQVLTKDFRVEVREVDDGLGALEILREEEFDLVILDIHMRIVNGIETLEAIRRIDGLRALPVLMISGAAYQQQVQQLAALDVAGIIAKPFTTSILRDRLAPLLTLIEANRSARARLAPQPRLALDANSRLFIVGPDSTFRQFLHTQLSAASEVTTFAFAEHALRDAVSRAPQAIIVTGEDTLFPRALFAQKLHRVASARPHLFLCELPGAGTSPDEQWFDGRLDKVCTPARLYDALRPLVTEATMAALLMHPASPAMGHVMDVATAALEATLGTPTTHHDILSPDYLSDTRTVEAYAEVSAPGLVARLDVFVSHSYALHYASRTTGGTNTDALGDAILSEAIAAFAETLAGALCDAVRVYGVTAQLESVSGRAAGGPASVATAASDRVVEGAWTTGDQNVFVAGLRISPARVPHHRLGKGLHKKGVALTSVG